MVPLRMTLPVRRRTVQLTCNMDGALRRDGRNVPDHSTATSGTLKPTRSRPPDLAA